MNRRLRFTPLRLRFAEAGVDGEGESGGASGTNPFDSLLGGQGQNADPAGGDPDPNAGDGDDPDTDDDGADELGDKGKQALDRMKAKLKAERERRVAAEKVAAEKADADEAAKIRREAEEAATAKANSRIVRAEVRAAAAPLLADPADALNFLDLDQFEVDDDGQVDQDEIADAISELLARKPYLAAQGGSKSPKPDLSQGAGAGKGATTNAQRFAADLSRAGF